MITQARLKELLRYNPVTGEFTWLKPTSNRVKVGDIAGTRDAYGYVNIKLDGTLYKAHHLAWLYSYGRWPASGELDHYDTTSRSNALTNLRDATRAQNCANRRLQSNNTSGYKGVSWHKQRGKWNAYIKVNGHRKSLGLFDNPEDASRAYRAAAKAVFGEFFNEDGVAA